MQAESAIEQAIVGEAATRAARTGGPILASRTRPTSEDDALAFLARARASQHRALWLRPARGEALVGIGAAQVIVGHGAERFGEVAAAWRQLVSHAVIDDGGASSAGGPRLMGGFSFDPLREPSTLWSGFPDARLVLPERMLVLRDGVAWLTSNLLVDPNGAPNLTSVTDQSHAEHGTKSAERLLTPELWTTLVGLVSRGIRGGQLGVQKVVIARAQEARATKQIDTVAALTNLAAGYPGCTTFAIAHGDACFLGATPERLITLRGGTASTIALAGSFPRGSTPDEDEALANQLVSDSKELAEHALVVSALRDGLRQTCTRIIAEARPRVYKLPNLQHLLTPVRGQVVPGKTVIDLVECLHPTPAVGGYPRERALELIRAFETLDRGWYAGPIGWIDRHGEGEFVVGIRSALLRGEAATLFSGCGIVGESNAQTEFAESCWKLQPMLAALGAAA